MGNTTLQKWVDGFEKELSRRFKKRLKVMLIDLDNLKNIETIAAIVSVESGVTIEDMQGRKKNSDTIDARQVAIYLCRTLLKESSIKIGKYFNRDHSTVLYTVEVIESYIFQKDERIHDLILTCQKKIQQMFYENNV